MFGVDLNDPAMWQQSGGLIVLCVVLIAANVAQFRVNAMLMAKYVELLAQYHALGQQVLLALQQATDESRAMKESLRMYDMLQGISDAICQHRDRVEADGVARTTKR